MKKKKKPTNRLAHLKDKNEILDSIKEKMHLMSKTTKVKQVGSSLIDIFWSVSYLGLGSTFQKLVECAELSDR